MTIKIRQRKFPIITIYFFLHHFTSFNHGMLVGPAMQRKPCVKHVKQIEVLLQ